jgi:hypothetical protein
MTWNLAGANLPYEQTSLGIGKRFQAFDVHRVDDRHLLREGRLAFGCMCASEEAAPRQWHAKVLEIEERVEDTARKSDVGLVDAAHDHTQSDLNLDSDCK